MFENSRRRFLKLTGGTFAGLFAAKILVPSIANAEAPKAAGPGAPLVMVTEAEPLAKSLGYSADATKVDAKKWPKRAGAEGAKQFCYSCMFYQAKGDPKKTDSAPCTIFANKGVHAKAWCNSWTKNPKVNA
jgi:hypothetical protein